MLFTSLGSVSLGPITDVTGWARCIDSWGFGITFPDVIETLWRIPSTRFTFTFVGFLQITEDTLANFVSGSTSCTFEYGTPDSTSKMPPACSSVPFMYLFLYLLVLTLRCSIQSLLPLLTTDLAFYPPLILFPAFLYPFPKLPQPRANSSSQNQELCLLEQ